MAYWVLNFEFENYVLGQLCRALVDYQTGLDYYSSVFCLVSEKVLGVFELFELLNFITEGTIFSQLRRRTSEMRIGL